MTAVHGHAAGREHDRPVGGGGEGHHALIKDGATGEGIGGRQRHRAVTRLDEAHRVTCAVIGDDGVDDEFADADRPGLVGLGGDGGTGDGDLGRTIDGDDERTHRDARARDGHARSDAHGGVHRDGSGVQGRRASDEGTTCEGLVIGRSSGVRAERDLRVGIHRDDGRSGDEIGIGDRHARTETKGVDAADYRRT